MTVRSVSFLALVPFFTACAQQPPAPGAAAAGPAYVSEAPLPKGWPQPGPYGKVTEKSYPAYRAAFTKGSGETVSFWTLFMHIKRKDIPMTAPVEMSLRAEENDMARADMAFLYRSDEVGATGMDGRRVEVRDVPASRALSYTWQGPDTKQNRAKARAAIEAELALRKVAGTKFRLLGYNGPATPRDKATWELQAVLPR